MSWLERIYHRQLNNPGFAGAFVNPYFIVRRGLSRAIRRQAGNCRGVLLDYGCGSKPYAELMKVEQHVGVDVEVSGHDHSTSRVDVFFDGKTLPFADASFDSALCTEVLEHTPDAGAALREIRRVLKPGGRLLLTMPFMWGEHEVPYDFTRFTLRGATELLERAGYRIVAGERVTCGLSALLQLWNNFWLENLIARSPRWLRPAGIVALLAPANLLHLALGGWGGGTQTFFLNLALVAENPARDARQV